MTEKQKIFADEYLIDLNATRAYKVAYPRVKNDETAAAAAARLLRNVKVAAYVEKRMQDRQKRTEITQDMVLQELAAIAFANATDFAQIVNNRVNNTWKTIRMYPGNRTATPVGFDKNGLPTMYKDCKVNLIDCGVME